MSAALHLDVLQPLSRGDCADGPRPCPWLRCRHHLLIEDELIGRERLERTPEWLPGHRVHPAARNAPTLEAALQALPESCALDVAGRGDHTLGEVGRILGVSRERARQLEAVALTKLRHAATVRRLGRDG